MKLLNCGECEFCQKLGFKNVNGVKKQDFRLQKKCDFCQKLGFENVNFCRI